ncbi:DUF4198 domain-containing protein [Desulfobotulus sp. H1]|uniref:DUF4198 domain-containing protein n=1 Tax=Desulfobotulus pelophilus TaxID=2823377 RepID=A0ABT3N9Z7_9BACT|nr:DUF4198 domain-containing protein [Desulfobotulus pelophilus]MCW7754006.1 DUF4198 domain-containing protein [Desulfobotulus pelophilus]
MKKKLAKIMAGFFIGMGMLASQASAHDLWLNMTDYTPALWQHAKYAPTPRAKTVVYLGWGHSYPVADFISDRVWGKMERIEPDGTRIPMEVGSEGFRAMRVDMDTAGARVFAAETKPAFYGPVEGKENFHQVYYEKYAKALVSVLPQKTLPLDGPDSNPFVTPIGHRVEIIPLVNPNRLQPGDSIEVQVLVDGKTAADYEVTATSLVAPNAQAVKTRTDGKGKAKLSLETFYGPWIMVASRSFPATGEKAKQCESISYTATMTFALPYIRGN